MRSTALAICISALASCSGGDEQSGSGNDSSVAHDSTQTRSSTRLVPGPQWYAASRELDLTGDSVSESLIIVAEGRHVDSLVVHLSAVTGRDTMTLAAWDAGYMLIDPPDSVRAPGPSREAYIRAQLASTLEDARVAPFTGASSLASWPSLSGDPICAEDGPECLYASIARAAVEAKVEDDGDSWKLAVMADLAKPGRSTVTFSYGYESTEVYVWSPLAKRFFLVFSCC